METERTEMQFGLIGKIHATRVMTHAVVVKYGHIVIRYTDGANVVVQSFDYSEGLPEFDINVQEQFISIDETLIPAHKITLFSGYETNDHTNIKHLFQMSMDREAATVLPVTSIGNVDRAESNYPIYLLWPEGEAQSPLVPTQSYVYGDSLSYPEKQQQAVEAVDAFYKQCRTWLSEMEQYADLSDELGKHAGYWIRAAKRAIQIEFQKPDVDPLYVAKMARLAAQGPLGLELTRDFALRLNTIRILLPDGPAVASIWIKKGAGAIGDLYRVKIEDNDVYNLDSFEATYNSVKEDWIVENQPGIVTFDNFDPTPGAVINASASDPDMIIGAVTWQWQQSTDNNVTWTNIDSATGAGYTVPDDMALGTHLRAVATYEDNYGPGQTAMSDAIEVK